MLKESPRRGKKHLRLTTSLARNSQYSPIAQSVEHSAVNRSVVGSSPTGRVDAEWHWWIKRTYIIEV